MNRNQLLETYFRENYDQLIKFARYRVGNYSLYNAEDAVQEAFLRACKYWRTYNREEDLDNWFRKILRNCVNQIKNQERNNGVVYKDEIEEASTIEEVNYSKEIESSLSKVSDRDEKILNMRFFQGFKTIEIAKILDISHDVTRDVIRRFKIKIRR
jgi:RNA polymerase sigma factor (sigma-70 family)